MEQNSESLALAVAQLEEWSNSRKAGRLAFATSLFAPLEEMERLLSERAEANKSDDLLLYRAGLEHVANAGLKYSDKRLFNKLYDLRCDIENMLLELEVSPREKAA